MGVKRRRRKRYEPWEKVFLTWNFNVSWRLRWVEYWGAVVEDDLRLLPITPEMQ